MGLRGGRFILMASAGLLGACGVNPVKSNLPFDFSHPGTIEISVESDNVNLETDLIKMQTGKNLTTWNYPIYPEHKSPVSHQLTVHIGNTESSSTPAGFSFSMGNSDPRALDFQKADVLTISCKLNAIAQTAQSAELSMGFSDDAVTGTKPDMKELSDHVSTVCFNLLREVKWPVENPADTSSGRSTSTQPGWIPEIRIETETEAPPAGASPKISPVQPRKASNDTEPESKAEPESKTVTKEINKEGRKVYIIHNQGNPVIFKFGNERK